MNVRRLLIGGLFMLGVSLVICLASGLLMANRHSPEAILTELELLTPPGSSVADVEFAIRKRRWEQGMCWSEEKNGRKTSITVQYADFWRTTVPPERTVIESHWHFGPDGKLHDISLDYFHSGIIAIGMTKENEKPIFLSDHRQ